MGSPVSDHWQRSVPLKESSDSCPLKDVVICCTSVPDEKRVSLPIYRRDASTPTDGLLNYRPCSPHMLKRWVLYIDMI